MYHSDLSMEIIAQVSGSEQGSVLFELLDLPTSAIISIEYECEWHINWFVECGINDCCHQCYVDLGK